MFKKLSVSTLALMIGAGAQAYAQTQTEAAAEADTVIVTGTRVEGRTAFDSVASQQSSHFPAVFYR